MKMDHELQDMKFDAWFCDIVIGLDKQKFKRKLFSYPLVLIYMFWCLKEPSH